MDTIKLPIFISIERITRAACGFTLSIFLIKNIGIANYGEYAYLMAIVSILNVAFSFGLDDYIIKETALQNKININLLYIRILFQCIPFLLTIIIFHHSKLQDYFYPLVATTLFYIWNLFYLLLITQESKNKLKTILAVIIISIIFNVLKFFISKYNLYYFSILSLIELILFSVLLFRSTSHNFTKNTLNSTSIVEILRSSISVGIASLLIVLFYKTDQIIVEYFLGKEQLGIYALASNIVLAFGFLQSSYVSSRYSYIGKMLKESPRELNNTLCTIYFHCFLIGILIYIIYFFIGNFIFSLIIGKSMNEINNVLYISLISIIFSGFAAINSQYLFLKNKQKIRLYRTIIALTINLIMNVLLLPIYGIQIAAIAFLITQILMGTILNIFNKETRHLTILQLSILYPRLRKYD